MAKTSWPALPLFVAAVTWAGASACTSATSAPARRRAAATTAGPHDRGPGRPAQFTPTTVYSGGDGSSVENAVVVMAKNEDEGVRRENEWIFAHHGTFRKTGVGLATVEKRKYDAIRVELADHSEKEIFFDITSFFGKNDTK
jgi:hypothetical protein